MGEPNKITGLIRTEGKTRVYQMDDGSQEAREGGTVSWRNNNPGNLKFEYAGSADKTVTSSRTPEAALAAAQARYGGVVALDQWGNAIFETQAAGRAAKAQLLTNTHGERTIPEMLGRYAKDDYTGKANTDAYANSVYAEGDRQGVELRDKKIRDLSSKEFEALLDGMKKVEGFQEGAVTRTPAKTTDSLDVPIAASRIRSALSPEQQRVHQMAIERLSGSLGANYSPEQIDTIAGSVAQLAATNAHRGEGQGVFLSKDQQTIALKQTFGISEIGVQEALSPSAKASPLLPAMTAAQQHTVQPEAEQRTALSR